jgi:hypothetical protein
MKTAYGAPLIALEDNPRIDVNGYLDELDALAVRVESRCVAGEPPVFRPPSARGDVRRRRLPRRHAELLRPAQCVFELKSNDRKLHPDHAGDRVPPRRDEDRPPRPASACRNTYRQVQFELNEVYVDPFDDAPTLTIPEIGARAADTGGLQQLMSKHLRAWNGRDAAARAREPDEHVEPRGDCRVATAKERMELLAR